MEIFALKIVNNNNKKNIENSNQIFCQFVQRISAFHSFNNWGKIVFSLQTLLRCHLYHLKWGRSTEKNPLDGNPCHPYGVFSKQMYFQNESTGDLKLGMNIHIASQRRAMTFFALSYRPTRVAMTIERNSRNSSVWEKIDVMN